ncbi:type IV toxin-antitoxin system AbiEi family antitoxin domain-containing protein [Kribbella sp. CA-245084]|uniref:type IV toxin-antitoxin system AbiEi family antitoxin domain-containing protein n=1 Tax=Kribbella sp. CA-245084 TaxID=3239940 RepID=UPI003D8E96F5
MNPKLRMQTDVRGGWFSRADALAAGYADSQIRVRLRSGQWRRLTRDAYVEPAAWPVDETPWERSRRLHLLMIRAALGRLSPDVVVSHQSAAVLHGLPTWGLDLSKVHVTRIEGRPRSDSLAAVHRTQIGMDEIVEVDGLRVVTPARAITETACVSSYEVGVVLGDAALHQGLATPAQLVAQADRHACRPGSPAARAAARFADGLSESVGESRLRVLMADEQLPAPTLQVEIRDDDGRLIGRVDFLLLGKVIVEFDGAEKYGDAPAAVVLAEKQREDRLRARGYRVLRTSWGDLDRPRITGARLRGAL